MAFRSYSRDRVDLINRETSCVELVSRFLSRIEQTNAEINAFVSLDEKGALARASELDVSLEEGKIRPLTGMVVGVKDVICRRDHTVSCSSRILQGFTSVYDATAVKRLEEAGAIIIGSLNCDEFAMGSSNENSVYGPVKNPANPAYVPGGSSGGSAAAVAAGMCHATLGTDTGGSVRLPASFCGVAALKPTYGRVSRLGLVAFASSFDCIGPLAHSVDDLALMLQEMAGADAWDSTSSREPVDNYDGVLEGGLKVGLPSEYFAAGLDPEVRSRIDEQVKHLKDAGATVHEVFLPHTEYGIATYYILTNAEASSNLARYDGVRYGYRADLSASSAGEGRDVGSDSALDELYTRTRSEGFGAEVKRRIMLGTYVLSAGYYDAYYGKAQRVRRLIQQDFENVFNQVDVLLTPAAASTAFPIGSRTADPLSMYLTDVYTVNANLAGIPGLVVPAGRHQNGLPVGAQLLGPRFSEKMLLAAGRVLEQAQG